MASAKRGPQSRSVDDRDSKEDGGDFGAGSVAVAAKRARVALREVLEETETDPHRLEQRRKALANGKNTLGYTNYIAAVPK